MLRFNSRSLFLVLGVVILLIVFVGCSHTNDNIPDDTKDNQSSEVQPVTPVTTEDDGVISFSAEPYIQEGALSWEYSLDIKIANGKIYIHDILYDGSTSPSPVIEYNEGFLTHARHTDETKGTEIANTLTKIENSETCYLLETQQHSPVGEKICVYEIDDVFYFVRFYDNGKVMRIHYAPIAQIEGCTNGALIFPTRVIE